MLLVGRLWIVCLCLIAVARPASASPSAVLAVFELRPPANEGPEWKTIARYLTTRIREQVLLTLPRIQLMTHENLLVLLEASGKHIEDCEGECEIETGRRIGAELVINGEITKLNNTYRLALRLHETKSGTLLGSSTTAGSSAEELDRALPLTVGMCTAMVPDRLAGRTPTSRVVGYASIGTAIVAAGTASVLGWRTQVASSEWAAAKDYQTWSAARTRTDTLATATTVTWIAAGILAVAGGVLISTSF